MPVGASSFTGTFTDYGKDTGSDGLYNFLTIEAEVDVTGAPKNYSILGIIQDSDGNFYEYEECSLITSNGIQNFTLDFEGVQFYKNQVDGPYNLSFVEITNIACEGSTGGGFPPEPEDNMIDAYVTQAYSYHDFQTGTPAIYCNNSPCVAGPDLIKSRDNIANMPEPNSPNTVDGCEDGSSGSYLSSESIESISVTSLNHSYFKIGDTIQVDTQVYCSMSNFDKINFVYANNINNVNWAVKDFNFCSSTGLKTLSTTFNLDHNIGYHAVRGLFGFDLNFNTVCGQDERDSTFYWVDQDDIVIYVKECEVNGDCGITGCDYLDGCYSGTYQDYDDVANNCAADSCQSATCSVYAEIITDNDLDGYDIECDNDCEDTNSLINPGASEICDNLKDDDCDGYTDLNDPDCFGRYPIDLNAGWNLVSLPKIDNNSVDSVLTLINGTRIATLVDGEWYFYDPVGVSNLEIVTESNGFWVEIQSDSTLLIDNESAVSTIFNLVSGWNLIGYPSLLEKDVGEVFSNVLDDVELAYFYDGVYVPYNPANPSSFIIKPGMGIFVKIKNDVSWYFSDVYKRGEQFFDLNLSSGWNLISIPLDSIKNVSSIFGTNKLYYFDEGWKVLSDGDKINYSYGYWIDSSSNVVVGGQGLDNVYFDIKQGWNLINYPKVDNTGVDVYFTSVMGNIESVMIYDGGWKSYSPLKTSNSLADLAAGKGVFVKAKSNAQWYYDGNVLS